MKREREFEALGDSKKERLENNVSNLESPHLVNSIQQQFLQQQHQYLQLQLQHVQQQQQQEQKPHQHLPLSEHHWGIQGQVVPRPALPAHMLPYAMQSCLPRPYSQPSAFPPQHHTPLFPQYPTYLSDPNTHHMISNSHLHPQQTSEAQNFTNIPDHTPSPSPSPNPPLSPNVEEYQTLDTFSAASYESTGAISNEHSTAVSYSNQSFTPVEYPSPAQSPVEHPAEVVINNSSHPQDIDPYSPARFPVPSSPYTSCLPNPPPNSPAVVSYVDHPSDTIIRFQQLINGVNTCQSENNVISNTRPIAKKPSVDDKNITENISKPSENFEKFQLKSTEANIPIGKFHERVSVTKPVFQENLDGKSSSDSSCNKGYVGAFAALIKSMEPNHSEHGNDLGKEEIGNCEMDTLPLINQQIKEDMQHNIENSYEIDCIENKKKDDEKELGEKKPFTFSPFLYKYLNYEQKEDGIETLDWCSEICTPPESPPSATNSSTPTSSPTGTAASVPLITLTPCTAYLDPSDENCSAMSELRDERGVLCQGGDILMRTADGSLRIVGSPVKFDDTTITEGSMSPNYQVESPSQTTTGYFPKSAASSPGSDILGDIMTQVGLVGVSAEEDMCLDEHVIGIMEEKGPSPSFSGEAQEVGYHQQRQFACHLCHCVFHDAWNLQVHMVSHPTPTPRPRRRSKTSTSSPEHSSLDYQDINCDFIPPHLTPSLPKGTKFRRGGRRATNKENTSPPQQNLIGKYPCPECNIGYPSQGHMKRHMESHGANRKFPCDMCTASYSRRDNLDKHRNQHLVNHC